MKIIAFDPGFRLTGIVIVDCNKRSVTRVTPASVVLHKLDIRDRLRVLFDHITDLLTLHQPDHAVAEQVFFARNFNSALKLAKVSGVIETACHPFKKVEDYSTCHIKKVVTGSGNAKKQDVRACLTDHCDVAIDHLIEDEVDALAAALTFLVHQYDYRNLVVS